jgi:hypothetical protein
VPAVESRAILSVDYDPESRTLFVRFRDSGELYAYFEVPEAEYDSFLAAESKGQFFAEHVKPQYDFHHVR